MNKDSVAIRRAHAGVVGTMHQRLSDLDANLAFG